MVAAHWMSPDGDREMPVLLRDLLEGDVEAVLLEDPGLFGERQRRKAGPARKPERNLRLLGRGRAGKRNAKRGERETTKQLPHHAPPCGLRQRGRMASCGSVQVNCLDKWQRLWAWVRGAPVGLAGARPRSSATFMRSLGFGIAALLLATPGLRDREPLLFGRRQIPEVLGRGHRQPRASARRWRNLRASSRSGSRKRRRASQAAARARASDAALAARAGGQAQAVPRARGRGPGLRRARRRDAAGGERRDRVQRQLRPDGVERGRRARRAGEDAQGARARLVLARLRSAAAGALSLRARRRRS